MLPTNPYASPGDPTAASGGNFALRTRSRLAAKALGRFRRYAFLCGGAWAGLSFGVMFLIAVLLFRLHGDTKYGGSAAGYLLLVFPAVTAVVGIFAARGQVWAIYGILAVCYLAMLRFAVYFSYCGVLFFIPLAAFGHIALYAAAQHRRLLAEIDGIPPEYRG